MDNNRYRYTNINLNQIVDVSNLPYKDKQTINNKFEFLKDFLLDKEIIKHEDDIPDEVIKDLLLSAKVRLYNKDEEIYSYEKEVVNNFNFNGDEIDNALDKSIELFILLQGKANVFECREEQSGLEINLLKNRKSLNPIQEITDGEVFGSLNKVKEIYNEVIDNEILLNEEQLDRSELLSRNLRIKIISEDDSKVLTLRRKADNFIVKNRKSALAPKMKIEKSNPPEDKVFSNEFLNERNVVEEDKPIQLNKSNFFCSDILDKLFLSYVNDLTEYFALNRDKADQYMNTLTNFSNKLLRDLSLYKSSIKLNALSNESLVNEYSEHPEFILSHLAEIKESKIFKSLKDKKRVYSFYLIKYMTQHTRKFGSLLTQRLKDLESFLVKESSDNPNFFTGKLKTGIQTEEFRSFIYSNTSISATFDSKKLQRSANNKEIEKNRKQIKDEDTLFEKTVYCIKCQILPRNVIGSCNHLLYCDECMKLVSTCQTCGVKMENYMKLYRC